MCTGGDTADRPTSPTCSRCAANITTARTKADGSSPSDPIANSPSNYPTARPCTPDHPDEDRPRREPRNRYSPDPPVHEHGMASSFAPSAVGSMSREPEAHRIHRSRARLESSSPRPRSAARAANRAHRIHPSTSTPCRRSATIVRQSSSLPPLFFFLPFPLAFSLSRPWALRDVSLFSSSESLSFFFTTGATASVTTNTGR